MQLWVTLCCHFYLFSLKKFLIFFAFLGLVNNFFSCSSPGFFYFYFYCVTITITIIIKIIIKSKARLVLLNVLIRMTSPARSDQQFLKKPSIHHSQPMKTEPKQVFSAFISCSSSSRPGGRRKEAKKRPKREEKENPRWAREAEALTERRLEKNPFLSLMNRSRRIFHFSSLFRIFFYFIVIGGRAKKASENVKKLF